MLKFSFKRMVGVQKQTKKQTIIKSVKICILYVLVSVCESGQVQLQASTYTVPQQRPHCFPAVALYRLALHILRCLFTPSSPYLSLYLSSFSLPRHRFPVFSHFLCPHPSTPHHPRPHPFVFIAVFISAEKPV